MGGNVSRGQNNTELVDNLINLEYLKTEKVIKVFRSVDRGDYVSPDARNIAYTDTAWRSDHIHLSAPCIYSYVVEALQVEKGMSFLNIGSGTGYLSTIVGLLLGEYGVNHGIELHKETVQHAECCLEIFMSQKLPLLKNVSFCKPIFAVGNALLLFPNMTYDRIYCGARCPIDKVNFFKRYLKLDGCLILPIGNKLCKIERNTSTVYTQMAVTRVAFSTLAVPKAPNLEVKQSEELLGQPDSLYELTRCRIRDLIQLEVFRRHPELAERLSLTEQLYSISENRTGFGKHGATVNTNDIVDIIPTSSESSSSSSSSEDGLDDEDDEDDDTDDDTDDTDGRRCRCAVPNGNNDNKGAPTASAQDGAPSLNGAPDGDRIDDGDDIPSPPTEPLDAAQVAEDRSAAMYNMLNRFRTNPERSVTPVPHKHRGSMLWRRHFRPGPTADSGGPSGASAMAGGSASRGAATMGGIRLGDAPPEGERDADLVQSMTAARNTLREWKSTIRTGIQMLSNLNTSVDSGSSATTSASASEGQPAEVRGRRGRRSHTAEEAVDSMRNRRLSLEQVDAQMTLAAGHARELMAVARRCQRTLQASRDRNLRSDTNNSLSVQPGTSSSSVTNSSSESEQHKNMLKNTPAKNNNKDDDGNENEKDSSGKKKNNEEGSTSTEESNNHEGSAGDSSNGEGRLSKRVSDDKLTGQANKRMMYSTTETSSDNNNENNVQAAPPRSGRNCLTASSSLPHSREDTLQAAASARNINSSTSSNDSSLSNDEISYAIEPIVIGDLTRFILGRSSCLMADGDGLAGGDPAATRAVTRPVPQRVRRYEEALDTYTRTFNELVTELPLPDKMTIGLRLKTTTTSENKKSDEKMSEGDGGGGGGDGDGGDDGDDEEMKKDDEE